MDAESEKRLPFEVIAYTIITLAIPEEQHGYSGRSHSLWYCDAQEKGVFRWYETAFFNWSNTNRVEPFALFPTAQDAVQAYQGISFPNGCPLVPRLSIALVYLYVRPALGAIGY